MGATEWAASGGAWGAIKDEPGQRRQRVDPTRGQAPAPRELGTSGCRSRGCEWLDKPLQIPTR